MPRWVPDRRWAGQDAYIVGGGPSLAHFDWGLIRGKNTIGCNSAFVLGADVIQITLFCDTKWWSEIGRPGTSGDQTWWRAIGSQKLARYSPELVEKARHGYGGLVVGSHDKLLRLRDPWLLVMPRYHLEGLSPGPDLGFFHNVGGSAINLALILGAKRVFLLGFDMKLRHEPPPGAKPTDNLSNWHHLRWQQDDPDVYPKFLQNMEKLKATHQSVFPGTEIYNVTDDSAMNLFPKVSLAEHFGVRA